MTKESKEWWEFEKSVVYTSGMLGECPPRSKTRLSPIDKHPLIRHAALAWAFVYKSKLDKSQLRQSLSQVLRDFPLLAGRFAKPKSKPWFRRGQQRADDEQTDHSIYYTSNAEDAHFMRHVHHKTEDLVVLHNNAGVPVTFGKCTWSSTDFKSHCMSVSKPTFYTESMNLSRVYRGLDPIMSIRVTYLLDGGTILGVTVPHAIVDGRSLASFLLAWSNAYQGRDYTKPVINRSLLSYQPVSSQCTTDEIHAFNQVALAEESSADRDKLDLAADIACQLSSYNETNTSRSHDKSKSDDESPTGHFENDNIVPGRSLISDLSFWKAMKYLSSLAWQALKGAGLHSIVVQLSLEQITKTKEQCQADHGGSLHISKNDIAVAYSWILLRKLQQRLGYLYNTDRSDKSRMLFAADLRVQNRLSNSLAEEFFGNAVLAVAVHGTDNMSLASCACNVRRAVNSLNHTKTHSTIDHVWKVQQQPLYRQIPALVETLPCYHDCFVTSWSFPLSEIHFGLNAPCSFYPGMFPRIPWTAIVLNDVNSDGIYIHMCLPSPAYDVFQSEPALHDHVNGIRVVDIPE